MNSENSRPTIEILLDWIEGRLSADEADAVAMLVAQGDDQVVADVEWLHGIRQLRNEVNIDEPPSDLRGKLVAQFTQHHQKIQATRIEQDPQPGFLQKLIATLSFDSGLEPEMTGARKVGTDANRVMIYASDRAEVVLTIQSDQQKELLISGQLLLTSGQSAEQHQLSLLNLDSQTGNEQQTKTDSLGQFAFSSVSSAKYRLTAIVDDAEIVIELPSL